MIALYTLDVQFESDYLVGQMFAVETFYTSSIISFFDHVNIQKYMIAIDFSVPVDCLCFLMY